MRKFMISLFAFLFFAAPAFADDIGVGKPDSAAGSTVQSTDDDIGVGYWLAILDWFDSEA